MRKRIGRLKRRAMRSHTFKAWKFYARYYRKKFYILLISLVLTIAQAALFLPIAILLRRILNDFIKAGDTRRVVEYGIAVLGMLLAGSALRLVNKRMILRYNKGIHKQIRNDLFTKMYDVPKLFYTRLEGMRWHTIFTHDIMQIDSMSAMLFTSFAPAVIICGVLAIVMVYINWLLFVIVLALAPVVAITMIITTRRIKHLFYVRRKAIQKFSSRINFALEMMDLTRIQVAEDEEINKQDNYNTYLQTLDFKTAWHGEVFRTLQETVIMAMTVVLLVGGGVAAISATISIGDLFTFYVVFMFNRRYLFQLMNFIPSLLNGNEAINRIYDIVSVDESRPYAGTSAPSERYDIEVDNVSFSYSDEPLLENVTLRIGESEFVALQGDNGSGKTTLLYIILGFYRPHSGEVRFGGIPHNTIDIKKMRREFGVVLQESPIFRGTIQENILYGRSDIDRTSFDRACRIAGVESFIGEMEDGYDTKIGDRGLTLSGGQRQRIAIARALLTMPKVLVLDEPTNHLDRDAVKQLLNHLRNPDYSPTIIMISHIDEFVSQTDRIIRVADNGVKVIEPVHIND